MNESKWTCSKCGFELVEVSKEYLQNIKDKLYIKSLPKNWEKRKNEIIRICPRCDAYALGIDFIEGPPLRKNWVKLLRYMSLQIPVCGKFTL
jgi:ribosomal protein S27AE